MMKIYHNQKGIALLMLVFIIALAFTAYVVKTLNSTSIVNERSKKTSESLSESKAAILGWSVIQSNPGQLPCPEDLTKIGTVNEGVAQVSCNSLNPVIGRLPWRTLGLGDIRDGNGDKLWYVISSGFQVNPINSAVSIAQLNVDGKPNSAVAIIFSAGMPFPVQVRPALSLAPSALNNYLEGTNNDGDISFVTTDPTKLFNDRLMIITKADLFNVICNRVLREIKGDITQGLVQYNASNLNYPFADINADGIADNLKYSGTPSYTGNPGDLFFKPATLTMLKNNGWFPLINYVVNPSQQVVTLSLNGKTMQIP